MDKTLCVIPARMASSRFPNKPLYPLLGMPMIGHVVYRCLIEKIFDKVIVATCDDEIMHYCSKIGVESIMTSNKHERASDRAQEAAQVVEKYSGHRFESVTLVQGDEPTVTPRMLTSALKGLDDSGSPVVNLCSVIESSEELNSVNCIKVVRNLKGEALYFSRSPIPNVSKAKDIFQKFYKQVCIIPFKRDFLDLYSAIKPTPLEETESVDMNRVLEHGFSVYCAEIHEKSYSVDVLEDAVKAEAFLKTCPLTKKYLTY